MADRRKLQKEIDMCIKKIAEGVEEFDDVFEKLQASSNQNQKEKKEEELKKVIKKLQRNRDQIKAWQQSNEVKDKAPLLKYRQLIERQMERFKIIERETKTKAYSKEGLLGISAKVDPAQREKDDCRSWLHETIDKLQQQKEQCEASIDQLSSKRKKVAKADQEQIDDLQVRLDRHLYYTTNLETLMRLLDNDEMSPGRITEVRDHVEYYVDNNDEDESLYMDEPDLFSDFDLEEVQRAKGISITNEPVFDTAKSDTSSDKGSKSSKMDKESESKRDNDTEHHEEQEHEHELELRKRNKSSGSLSDALKSLEQSISAVNSLSSSTSVMPVPNVPSSAAIIVPPSSSSTIGAALTSSSSTAASVNSSIIIESPQRRAPSRTPNFPGLPSSTPAKSAATPVNFAKAAAGANSTTTTSIDASRKGVWGPSTSLDKPEAKTEAPSLMEPIQQPIQQVQPPIMMPTQPSEAAPSLTLGGAPGLSLNPQLNPDLTQQPPITTTTTTMSEMPTPPEEKKIIAPPPNLTPQSPPTFDHLANHVQPSDLSKSFNGINLDNVNSASQDIQRINETVDVGLGELVGTTPIMSKQVEQEHNQMRFAVEAAFKHFPQLSDSEKPRNYMYRQPTPYCPPYYPKTCLRDMHTPEFFTKMPHDTLFYIFYYMEGTRAQYLAAWALKKSSWRFHTKYMMWFQRHEEPKVINDEYEQGTYVYFDYEKWQQRRKDGFTFEYRYLEDRELPING